MRIVEPSYEIMDFGELPLMAKIERVGRVCYKSEHKITDGSASRFVGNLIANKHHAMLEHASIILEMNYKAYRRFKELIEFYEEDTALPAFVNITHSIDRFVMSANVRAWRELFSHFKHGLLMPTGVQTIINSNDELFGDLGIFFHDEPWYGSVKQIAPSKLIRHEEIERHTPMTVRFTVDIAVARELCRHRLASHAGSSTRYCDYSKGKFGSEISVVEPDENSSENDTFMRGALYAESKYLEQRQDGITPEIARSSLPLGTMCEHVMTMPLEKWKHVFNLRALDKTGKAHPQVKRVMVPLLEEVEKKYPFINWR